MSNRVACTNKLKHEATDQNSIKFKNSKQCLDFEFNILSFILTSSLAKGYWFTLLDRKPLPKEDVILISQEVPYHLEQIRSEISL